jgi:hypothetical protein
MIHLGQDRDNLRQNGQVDYHAEVGSCYTFALWTPPSRTNAMKAVKYGPVSATLVIVLLNVMPGFVVSINSRRIAVTRDDGRVCL